jgi:hypothetical protein
MLNVYLFNEALFNQPTATAGPGVIHAVLDGCYQPTSPGVNRAYVIGKDEEDYPVFGSDEDTDDINLVGERLDFKLLPSLVTAEQASDAAAAALAYARLSKHQGTILVPPHCGVELWDVISITDPVCAQDTQSYRVTGIMLIYDPQRQRYQQRLTLGGV